MSTGYCGNRPTCSSYAASTCGLRARSTSIEYGEYAGCRDQRPARLGAESQSTRSSSRSPRPPPDEAGTKAARRRRFAHWRRQVLRLAASTSGRRYNSVGRPGSIGGGRTATRYGSASMLTTADGIPFRTKRRLRGRLRAFCAAGYRGLSWPPPLFPAELGLCESVARQRLRLYRLLRQPQACV